MGGFRELAALTANGGSGVAPSDALLPAGQLRGYGKRKRTGADQLQLRAPSADNLDGVRSAYEGFDAAASQWLAALAEREAGVTVREAACCGVQAQLAARSAELAAREGRLADWDARLRSWDAQLQRLHSQLKDQEERLHMALQPSGRDKENSTPEDTDSELDITGGHRDPEGHRGGSVWAQGTFPAANTAAWPGALGFHRYWEGNNASAAVTSLKLEEHQSQQQQSGGHTSPTLHIAPLSCGLRIVKSGSGGDATADDAAAGSPRAAGGAAASAESPSECSAGAAGLFPDEAAHTGGSFGHHHDGEAQDVRNLLSPASADARPEQRFQLPLFQQQEQPEQEQVPGSHAAGAGQLLESLAQAAEEVERRAVSAAAARPQPSLPPQPLQEASGVFSKTLDYKSCDHIMCLTKDMARHLFPQPPHSSAGGPSQMSIELEDDSGRLWPMTYRCVPHRYSYELRAGWKTYAAFWAVGVGDTVSLWREPTGRLRISVHAVSGLHATPPAAGTRGRPGAAA